MRLAPHRINDPSVGRAFARPYRDVAARLIGWAHHGQVILDDRDALYVHEYTVGGLTARGLVGALDVTARLAPGDVDPVTVGVSPHENVHPDQVRDLAERMDEMRLDPAPILLTHRASVPLRGLLDRVRAERPFTEFSDRSGCHHRLWRITAQRDLDLVSRELAQAHLLIADGHHRYGAYLELAARQEAGRRDSGLAMLVDQDDTPLFVGAIHRFLPGLDWDRFLSAATGHGTVECRASRDDALSALGARTLVVTDGQGWATLTMPATERLAPVQWLHQVVLDETLDTVRDPQYHHAADAAIEAAASEPGVTVLLPAPDVDLIARVAAQGKVLPEKATSFQPKPPLGVLMRRVPT